MLEKTRDISIKHRIGEPKRWEINAAHKPEYKLPEQFKMLQ